MRTIRSAIWTMGEEPYLQDTCVCWWGECFLVETPNIKNGRLHLSLIAWLGWQLGFLKGTEWFPVVILEYIVMGYLVAHRKMFQLKVQFGSLMASSLEVKNLWLDSVEYALGHVWSWGWRAGRIPGSSHGLEGLLTPQWVCTYSWGRGGVERCLAK